MYSKAECEYPLCVTDIAIGGMKENNMSYSFESRVRFSEIGENGCLDLPGVLDYFQDCCTVREDGAWDGSVEGAETCLGAFSVAGSSEEISETR